MARTAYLEHDGPIVMAHRGFSLEGLENSMAGFAAAVDLGCRYVETDVHATSDGALVAFHDDRLDRVTDRAGLIGRSPWSEVSRARIGGVEPVPLLEDVLGTWPELRVNVDIKAAPAILPLVRVIERTGAHERVCVNSFSDGRRLAALRRLGRPVATAAGRTVSAQFFAALGVPGAAGERLASRALREVDALQLPERFGRLPLVTPASIAAAHRAGVEVHVWTVNAAADMVRLLEWGVDGIITDRPDRFLQQKSEGF